MCCDLKHAPKFVIAPTDFYRTLHPKDAGFPQQLACPYTHPNQFTIRLVTETLARKQNLMCVVIPS